MLHLLPAIATLKRLSLTISVINEVRQLIFGDAPHRKSGNNKTRGFTAIQRASIKAEYAKYLYAKATKRQVYKNLDQLVLALNQKFGISQPKADYIKVWKNP